MYYPLSLPFLYVHGNHKLIHIYSNLCDRPYLPIFKSKNTILSSTNFISKERIKKSVNHLIKLKKIIVQAEIQKKELLDAGIPLGKISLIYPPVNLERFSYTPPSKDKFTILCATTPAKTEYLQKRGIYLLLHSDSKLEDTQFKILLRGTPHAKKIIESHHPLNIATDNNL